jgi:predicted phosphodiesterase
MNIAVLSDIHGFSIALKSVLDDIQRIPGIDRIIAAGDVCEGGPDPAGALDLLRSRGIWSVQGNTDRDLVAGTRTSAAARWVVDQLGQERLDALGAFPFSLRITPVNGRPLDDDLLVVHANPFDQDRHIHPGASDQELHELIGDSRAGVIAFGHLHIAFIRRWNEIDLIDVSSVGNSRDGDLRSKWGLCSWDAGNRCWTTELRYVEYPLAETLNQMRHSRMPNWEKAADRLQRASYGD